MCKQNIFYLQVKGGGVEHFTHFGRYEKKKDNYEPILSCTVIDHGLSCQCFVKLNVQFSKNF